MLFSQRHSSKMLINFGFVISVCFSLNCFVTGNTEERFDKLENQLATLQSFILQVRFGSYSIHVLVYSDKI